MVLIIEGTAGQESREALAKKMKRKQEELIKTIRHDHPGMTESGQETKAAIQRKVDLFIARGLITPSTN